VDNGCQPPSLTFWRHGARHTWSPPMYSLPSRNASSSLSTSRSLASFSLLSLELPSPSAFRKPLNDPSSLLLGICADLPTSDDAGQPDHRCGEGTRAPGHQGTRAPGHQGTRAPGPANGRIGTAQYTQSFVTNPVNHQHVLFEHVHCHCSGPRQRYVRRGYGPPVDVGGFRPLLQRRRSAVFAA
jgi:hypothetical protein